LSENRALCLHFGNTNLRLHSPTQQPNAPAGIPDMIPTIMMLDERLQEVEAFGQPALDRLHKGVDNRRFVTDLKPCLAQSVMDMAAVGCPVPLRAKLCPTCKVARQPHSSFCAQCGSRLSNLPAPTARSFYRYTMEEAFLWTECLFTQVAQDWVRRHAAAPDRLIAAVPAHWSEPTQTRYRELLSGCFQGVPVEIVTEQEAILRSHCSTSALDSTSYEKPVLIVDIGALTTDLSLCTLQANTTLPDSARFYSEHLGGGDFDVALAVYLTEKLGIPLDRGLPPHLIQSGRLLKEQYSRALSAGQDACTLPITLPVEGNYVSAIPVSLDRATFESESLCAGLIRQFDQTLNQALQHLRVSSSGIGAVIVTGGGAHWRFVQDTIRHLFSTARLIVGDYPERAVVEGLSLPTSSVGRPRLLATQTPSRLLKGVTPIAPQQSQPASLQRGANTHVYLPIAPEEALHGAPLTSDLPEQDGGEPGAMTSEPGIKPQREEEERSSDPPTILPEEETPTALPPVYTDHRAASDTSASSSLSLTTDREPIPAVSKSALSERAAPPARTPPNSRVIAFLMIALLLAAAIGGTFSLMLYSRLRDARHEAETAYRRIEEERLKRTVAEQALKKSEQERRRLAEELLGIKRRLSPFEVASYGADSERPSLGSTRNLQELGSGLKECYVYVVVKNNYYGLRDQNIDFAITVTWPNGQSATAKSRRLLSSTEERHIYSGRFYMARESLLPDGEYSYQIRINDQSVGQGSFTIP
jgi:hypothetical protein